MQVNVTLAWPLVVVGSLHNVLLAAARLHSVGASAVVTILSAAVVGKVLTGSLLCFCRHLGWE